MGRALNPAATSLTSSTGNGHTMLSLRRVSGTSSTNSESPPTLFPPLTPRSVSPLPPSRSTRVKRRPLPPLRKPLPEETSATERSSSDQASEICEIYIEKSRYKPIILLVIYQRAERPKYPV